jgi:hypothetical protein
MRGRRPCRSGSGAARPRARAGPWAGKGAGGGGGSGERARLQGRRAACRARGKGGARGAAGPPRRGAAVRGPSGLPRRAGRGGARAHLTAAARPSARPLPARQAASGSLTQAAPALGAPGRGVAAAAGGAPVAGAAALAAGAQRAAPAAPAQLQSLSPQGDPACVRWGWCGGKEESGAGGGSARWRGARPPPAPGGAGKTALARPVAALAGPRRDRGPPAGGSATPHPRRGAQAAGAPVAGGFGF